MRIVAVVQARFSSRRFPGKVLWPVRGRALMLYLFDALAGARHLDGIVLATSTEVSDDPVVRMAESTGLECFRGPLDDVASRLLIAARDAQADAFVRLNADSPMLDPALVDQGVELFRQEPVDIVTNAFPRTFPTGQGVEVISCGALSRALAVMNSTEREHVGLHFYSHPERYAIRSFSAAVPRPDVQLSVDEPADVKRFEGILGLLSSPPWDAGWEACVAAADALAGGASADASRRLTADDVRSGCG